LKLPEKPRPPYRAWTWVLAAVIICLGGSILFILHYSRGERLHGLLVDLELGDPDPSRYERLRQAFTRRLPQEVQSLRNCRVTLDYIHFSNLGPDGVDPDTVDFLLLSPQRTPWYRYTGEAGRHLSEFMRLLRTLIARDGLPVLGVCGGHQFLALAFGGTVDFIDPLYQGKFPERYPEEAVAERGVVTVGILRSDPILEGVSLRPGTFRAVESHYEEVKKVPEPFINLARTKMSEAQLIRYPGKPVYGVAFHPERCWTEEDCPGQAVEEGRRLLANFLTMVSTYKNKQK
jgi:GMP synthase-like glutamine amidotransferase